MIKNTAGTIATYTNIYQYVLNELVRFVNQYKIFALGVTSCSSYACLIDLINQSKTGIYKSKYTMKITIHIAISETIFGLFKKLK